jgi:hypothetical protein
VGAGARLPLEWGERCVSAAEAGQLKVLRWVREHDCPWDEFMRLCVGRWWMASGCAEVEAGAPLPVGPADV